MTGQTSHFVEGRMSEVRRRIECCWFAVDQVGHVGVFWNSGGFGLIPETAFRCRDFAKVFEELGGPEAPDEEDDESDYEEMVQLIAAHGIFAYDNYRGDAEEELPDAEDYYFTEVVHMPYELDMDGSPATPLRVDSLPPKYQKLITKCRFDGAVFGNGAYVQRSTRSACSGSVARSLT